jgi:hypothetical protein
MVFGKLLTSHSHWVSEFAPQSVQKPLSYFVGMRYLRHNIDNSH